MTTTTSPDLTVSLTLPEGWHHIEMDGAVLAASAEHPEHAGQHPTIAVFVRPTRSALTLHEEADRIIGRSRGMPFHPLAVTERHLDGRPAVLAAGVRQHERLGVQFQTVAVTRAAGRTIVVTGLCARSDAPTHGAVLRDLTHSLHISEED